MKEKELIKHIDKLLGKDKKKNHTPPCPEFNPDCANCRWYVLDGLLRWYRDVLK